MYKKSFLLNLEAEKLNSIDTYCKAMGIPRVKLFEELAEKWLSDNKNEIKWLLDYQATYLDRYKTTVMYDECMSHLVRTKTKDCISFNERETLKQIGCSMAETGEREIAMFFIDIAHRQRYVENNWNQMTLYDYIDRKYTNFDLEV